MKRVLQILLATALSALFVWLSLRGTDLSAVGHAIAGADVRYVAAYLAVLVGVHLARVVRWGLLLEPLAKVRFRELNALGAVGFMALMVLPLRLGELGRPYLVAEHLKVSKSAALASVVVERIVDGLAMGLVLVALLWTLGPEATGEHLARVRLGGALVTAAFGAGLAVLILAYRHREAAARFLRASVGRVSPGLADKLAAMLDAFTGGLDVVPSARKVAQFFLLTAVYWLLAGLGLKVIAPAFGFTLTVQAAFTVLGLQVIGSMIPAGPGMIGTMQFFTTLGVGLFLHGAGMEPRAAAFAHVVWCMQFAQQVLFGLAFVATGQVRIGSLFQRLTGGSDALPASPAGE